MKKKILFTTLALGAVALGVGSGVIALRSAPNAVKADTPVTISTLAQLKTYFDGAGTNCGNSATLAADIDLNGAYVSGMAGEFTATFNGNGHRLYNGKVGATTSLFNIIGTTGVVKNLTYDVTVTGAVVRPLSYLNNGTIQDSTAIIRTGAASVNNVAAYSYLAGSGTYTNLSTHWVVNHAGADWLCSIYRDNASTNVTGSYYTMNGSVATASNLQADGATLTTDAIYASPITSVSAVAGSSKAVTPEIFGSAYTSVSYVSSNTSAATVTVSGLSAVISGVASGSATITGTIVSTTKTLTITIPVIVSAATPVSNVSLDQTTISFAEGKTAALTATLTGAVYDHISWTSDAESVVSVSGSDLTATITAVAAGTGNVSITVFDASNVQLATASCAVTVTAASGFNLYLLEQQNWSVAYAFIYGEGPNTATAMTKVQVNSDDVAFRFADTTDNKAIKTYHLWKLFVNITVHPEIVATSYVQFYNQTSGRWGGGVQFGTITDGVVMVLPATAPQTGYKSSWAEANLTSTLNYAAGTIYGSSWRDADNSICYKKNNQTTLKTLIDGYDVLSTDVKAITDSLNDSTTAYTATYGETMVVLKSLYTSGNQANTIFSSDNKDNTALIAAIAGFSLVAVAAGTFILLRKKHE